MSQEVSEIAIAIAQPLKVDSSQILDFLKVHIGDVVNKQTILAAKKGMFGLGGIELKSPVEGIVHNIDTETGVIIINLGTSTPLFPIMKRQKSELLISDISSVKANKTIPTSKYKRTASSNYASIEGIFSCGTAKGSGWFIEYNFDSHSILPEMEGRIILISSMPTMSEIYKASAIGIAGMVVASKDIDALFLQNLKNDLSGKSHLAFLVLPHSTNLATLHGVSLEIDGEGKRLLYEKK